MIHATMFEITDKHHLEGLRNISEINLQKHWQKYRHLHFSWSVPGVYESTPYSVRGLRNMAMLFAVEQLAGSTTLPEAKEQYRRTTTGVREFAKEFLDFLMAAPFGSCSQCGSEKPVSVEALQCRCKQCGKGGAMT